MKKKNHVRLRFSTILLSIVAILLCAAPRGWAVVYDDGGEHKIETGLDWLHVGADTTVNLYADISQYVYAYPGSVLNIYSGNVGLYIIVMPGEPKAAVVTVYGTDFGGDGNFSTPGEVSFSGGTLTGYYADGSAINLLFYSNTTIFLQTLDTTEVKIDIKPGGNPNNINPRSKGVVPVAILSTETFNASNVDPESVTFAGASHVRWTLCDVDGNGDVDMLFHFKTQELFENDLNEDSIEATLTGTADGNEISGTDGVWIVPRKK